MVPAGLPLIRANKLRALAVTNEKRGPACAPDVPTIAESLPGFEAFGWYGLMAPVGTPAEIVKRLNAEAIAALKTEAL